MFTRLLRKFRRNSNFNFKQPLNLSHSPSVTGVLTFFGGGGLGGLVLHCPHGCELHSFKSYARFNGRKVHIKINAVPFKKKSSQNTGSATTVLRITDAVQYDVHF
jgi:hypothetical protein